MCMRVVDKKVVGRRLRAVSRELGYKSTTALAAYLGVERGAADAWLHGRAFPPVPSITKLIDEHGITLDWLFYGDPAGLTYAMGIRLHGLMDGLEVPEAEPGVAEVRPEEGLPLPVAKAASTRLPRKKSKAT